MSGYNNVFSAIIIMSKNQRVFDVKPTAPVISGPTPMSPVTLKNPASKEFFASLPKSHRKIAQDGNSFYRCAGIQYLTLLQSKTSESAFPSLSEVNLCISPEQLIPLQFRPYYYQIKLKTLLELAWSQYFPKYLERNSCYQQGLYEMLNAHAIVDLLIVLYFRAICLKQLQKTEEEIRPYLEGNQKKIISEYGSEPRGSIPYILGQALEVGVRVRGYDKSVKYDEESPFHGGKGQTLELFFKNKQFHIFIKEDARKKQPQNLVNRFPKKEKSEAPSRENKPREIFTEQQKTPNQNECSICPEMKIRQCFKCKMKQLNCPLFNKMMGWNYNYSPKQKLRQVQVDLKPEFSRQKKNTEKIHEKNRQVDRPNIFQSANMAYNPRNYQPEYSPEPDLVSPKVDNSVKQCIECEGILLTFQEKQTLICKKCGKDVQIEERIHQYRSKTAEKVKAKEPAKKQAGKRVYDYFPPAPVVPRYEALKKRYL